MTLYKTYANIVNVYQLKTKREIVTKMSTTSLSNLIVLVVVGSVIFSVFHAKDVRAAAALPIAAASYQAVRGFDNPIHLDLHTHVDRQTLSSLIKNVGQDKPLVNIRYAKKVHNVTSKKDHKLQDSVIGYHLPNFA